MLSRIRGLSARQGDLLLAAAVTALLVFELSIQDIDGPAGVNYFFGIVMTGALVWWRRWPVYVVSVQLVAAIVSERLGGGLIEQPFAPFFSILLSFYAVGRYAPKRWSELGLGIGVLGVTLLNLAGAGDNVGDYLFPIVIAIAAPWLAGRAVRVWAVRARELAWANKQLR